MPDIDIDFIQRDAALADLTYVPAANRNQGVRVKHQSGVYFQDIPVDPIDKLAVWEHKQAELLGFFKVDFLNNSIYQGVRDEAHLIELMLREPPWDRLMEPAVVAKLYHVGEHFSVVQAIAPRSVLDLAVCLALVRPGKRYLIGRPRSEIDREIWLPVENFYYKKPHAIAYSVSVTVQFNLLIETNQI